MDLGLQSKALPSQEGNCEEDAEALAVGPVVCCRDVEEIEIFVRYAVNALITAF